MPVEYEGGSIYHPLTVPTPDLHPSGLYVTLGLVLAPERCMTPAARPLLLLFVFYSHAAVTGRRSDEVVPFGVDQIHLWILEIGERRGRLFRYGHERPARVSGTISPEHRGGDLR